MASTAAWNPFIPSPAPVKKPASCWPSFAASMRVNPVVSASNAGFTLSIIPAANSTNFPLIMTTASDIRSNCFAPSFIICGSVPS